MKQTKKILCFGDSNTWGYDPSDEGRFFGENRWPSILATLLGACYQVEDDGLNGRTTNVDDSDFHGRNGLGGLKSSLERHKDLDLLIIMLGTNDLKRKFHRAATDIAEGISNLIELAKNFGAFASKPPGILILPPPVIGSKIPYSSFQDPTVQRSAEVLPNLYRSVAKRHEISFLDVNIAAGKTDGIHLDKDGHQYLGETIYEYVSRLEHMNG